MTTSKQHVTIYTDGGCRPNPGVGGWAAVLRYGEKVKELSGGEPESTNNRMELTAAVCALEALKKPCKIEFHTDSEYLKRGITEWMPGWKRRGWVRKEGALKNVDLWQRLDKAIGDHEIDWRWVRGHNGNPDNERCDELATQAIESLGVR
ncbi:MAG: ribonuclease H [Candidatus Hydrogenedentota bacterium]